MTDTNKLVMRLRDVLTNAYHQNEFAEFMFLHFGDLNTKPYFDYAGLPGATEYQKRVLEVLWWALRWSGNLTFTIKLARLACVDRPERNDLRQLVIDLDLAHAAARALAPVAPANPSNFVPVAAPVPFELTNSLELFRFKPRELTDDLRSKFRSSSHAQYDLPSQFHLSESEARRLAAVLALETYPDAEYLRWLSERITVEQPLIGYVAAQALVLAALRLTPGELTRVRACTKDAIDRLDGLVESNDRVDAGYDIAARKRLLQTAVSLVDMRAKVGKVGLPPAQLDAFLNSLLSVFDLKTFERLFEVHFRSALRFLVNLSDPFELVVVNVAVLAREKGWERDLVKAAYNEHSAEPAFVAANAIVP